MLIEFGQRAFYVPWAYRNHFLKTVFCVDSTGEPIPGKKSKYPIQNNELTQGNFKFKIVQLQSNKLKLKIKFTYPQQIYFGQYYHIM